MDLSWHLKWDNHTKTYYAKATKYMGVNHKPVSKTIHLHRVIADCEKSKQIIHHKNHDTLDNRKCNLEIVDTSTNLLKRKQANSNNSTGVRNVCYIPSINKYRVQLQINKKKELIGDYNTLEEAEKIAKKLRKKHYGC